MVLLMTHYTCGNIFTTQTWSIPDNTRIVGDEQQTVIKAVDSSMTVPFSGSYIIEMGGSNANGNLCPTSGSCISGDLLGNAGPSLDDEAFYFLDISSWAQANKGKDFYFESFDEARKAKVRRSTAGTDQSAFSGVVCGAKDRVDPHSARRAKAERTGGEFSRTAGRRAFDGELVSELVRCPAQDRGVAQGVQRGASAHQLGISNAAGLCCCDESV
jgi:hypothetical protein